MNWLRHDLYVSPLEAYIDPPFPVKKALITHAHADHARAGHESVLATHHTIQIMKRRYGENCADRFQVAEYGKALSMGEVRVIFYPAGHVLGSAQILLEYKGARAVVTGDYKTVPEKTSEAFELVPCDLLVTEATFGLPVFQHPDAREEIPRLLRSLQQQPERSHVVGSYALGKSQRVIRHLRDAGYDAPIYLHGSHEKLCHYYEESGIKLGELRKALDRDKEELVGAVIMAPPSALKDRWSRRLADPVIAYASGWMTIKQRTKQSLVECPLVISDHADWNELRETIKASGAETVWVTHGREDALVHWCKTEGIQAEPLALQGREEES